MRYCSLFGGVVMNIALKAREQKKQLILFIGDYVQLHKNFYGENSQWLEIIDIEPYDICLLSNGIRVCASIEYISIAKSAIEYKGLL